MSVESAENRPDPTLKVNVPQNNPFLRANSPMNSPPLSGSPAENRNSNNPFLDPDLVTTSPTKQLRSPPKSPPNVGMHNLSLADRPPPGTRREQNENGVGQAASRLLQMKPGEAPSGRPPMGRPPPPQGMDGRGQPRQRRPEGEKRIRTASEEARRRERHERRKKEREAGMKDSQGRPVPSQSGGRSKKSRAPHLDAIDKLDSTGSFLDPLGSGYHVSGPYDATVNRSARKLRPIDAFAADSLNMVMGGAKPTYDKHVHADARNMYGHVDDAVNDYTNAAMKPNAASTEPYSAPKPSTRRPEGFDATSKVDQIHGSETTGLGTSTFLDGAPAPASAIRRESESQDRDSVPVGGLSRTRSIAQRFRNQRGTRDRSNSSGVVTSPERRPAPGPPTVRSRTMSPAGASAGEPKGSLSAGGLDRINESKNPFFEDYNDAYDRKGEAIKEGGVGVTLEDKGTKPAPAPLTRSITESSITHKRTDSNASSTGGDKEKKEGGLIGRMKSFRGRKKEKTTE